MLRVLIADDEPLARERLQVLLAAMADVDVVGVAEDGIEAAELIGARRPDLVLLDIKMPGLNGFELLDSMPASALPTIVFVTAFDRFAVNAFERGAFDYLLKPVEAERLELAIDRARRARDDRTSGRRIRELEELVDNLRNEPPAIGRRYPRQLWVDDRGEKIAVPVQEIDWVGAERDYLRLYCGARSFLVRKSLSGMTECLEPQLFMRVHRSVVVNMKCIVRVRRRSLVLSTGVEVPMAKPYVVAVKKAVNLSALEG